MDETNRKPQPNTDFAAELYERLEAASRNARKLSKDDIWKIKADLQDDILNMSELECKVIRSYMSAYRAKKLADRAYIRSIITLVIVSLQLLLNIILALQKFGVF